ncbi:MAG TPA: hypothetical protein VMY76_07005 [Gemmatimonadales bacterium]|nr:hypothetical protein [Gemmatimonadales bacterium]
MLRALPILLAALLLPGARTLLAQNDAPLSASPTLPSDTLEANYAPRSTSGPTPELAPTLPSDTLEATEPVDSFPTDPFLDEGFDDDSVEAHGTPQSAGDSAALQDLRSWIRRHPVPISPPPVRAVLVRA